MKLRTKDLLKKTIRKKAQRSCSCIYI